MQNRQGEKSNLQNVRERIHQKIRKELKLNKEQHSDLYQLIQSLQTCTLRIKPQHNIYLLHLLLKQNTSIIIEPQVVDLGPVGGLNPKENVVSFGSTGNMNVKRLDFDFSVFPKTGSINFIEGGLESIEGVRVQKTKTEDINLNNNQIEKIERLPRFPFRLRRLNLSNNKIASLDFLISADLRNLTELDLTANLITSLEPLTQTDLKYLLALHLPNNKISSIDCFGRIDFKNLKKLDLSSNTITSIQEIRTVNILNFSWIELSRNQITDFSPILQMKSDGTVCIFNTFVDDYFPGIYIRQNSANDQELEELFLNSNFKLYTSDIEDQVWESLYERYGRYDNYGHDERVTEKRIRENEENSLEGDVLSEIELEEEGEQGEEKSGTEILDEQEQEGEQELDGDQGDQEEEKEG